MKNLISTLIAATLISACSDHDPDKKPDQQIEQTGNQTQITVKEESFTVTTNVSFGGELNPKKAELTTKENLNIKIEAFQGYLLDSVSGCNGILNEDIYTIKQLTKDCEVSATFKPQKFTLSTNSNGGGQIKPTKAIAEFGQSYTFDIEPDVGHELAHVSGCNGELNKSTFVVGKAVKDCEISASFEKLRYNVDVQVNEPSFGQVTANKESFYHGDIVRLAISPSQGHQLKNVFGCNGQLEGNNYTTAPLTSDCKVNVTFEKQLYDVEVAINDASYGSVNISSDSNFYHGSIVRLTFYPNDGYQLKSVNGCDGQLTDNTYTTAELSKNCLINVTFEPLQYNVDVEINDTSLGTVSVEESDFSYGSIVHLTISPNEGYEIKTVTGCSGELSNNTYITSALTQNCTVVVEFKPIGRLMLSFDDAYVESWWKKAHPVLQNYDMKAIFYINADFVKTQKQREYTDLLFKNGHIIGHHSCSHQFVGSYEGDYMADEIQRCIDFYKDYNLKHFAYPYGWAGWKADVADKLKARFETVRLFNTVWDSEGGPSSRPQAAASIDGVIIKDNWQLVWAFLEKTRAEGTTAHLSSHGVIDDCEAAKQGWQICTRDLQLVIDYAQSLGLELGPPKDWY
ncbi:hypothetical protein PA25_14810 [Pseudoalteromonas sp. A25]|uniref:InlB B-repeat-containing protein n=1 Tax=Pseudoalteromonas sp. A25 TaxID=116092 RepID=UPI0012612967|nr:polysaccharide deacetylase family protein [Pseudoalteromonas sp. A25]BBN81496.1 hypothetical protein PA25_14810 [Pseudoalteromonas sp. A25]